MNLDIYIALIWFVVMVCVVAAVISLFMFVEDILRYRHGWGKMTKSSWAMLGCGLFLLAAAAIGIWATQVSVVEAILDV